MRWLIQSASIVAPGSALHGKKRDILIENGVITGIKAKIDDDKAEVIRYPKLKVSLGWTDLRVDFRDPGAEYKEGLMSGLDAAAAGGFTGVVLMPRTSPVVDSKGQLEYLLRRSESHAVTLMPTGTLSQGAKGEQLAELYDLHTSGAVGFTDDRPLSRAELLRRALEYTQSFGGLVMSMPYDRDLTGHGVMHEGITSTKNGLKGIPVIAETTRVQRDLEILRYTGGRLHFHLITSEAAVKLIKAAKKEGLSVTCGVSANHLYFCDEDLAGYDRNLKTLPPFRTENDRKALVRGVKDGTIDVVCSDHKPQDIEAKKREFGTAEYGVAAIEQCFSAGLASGLNEDALINSMTAGADSVLGMERTLEEGVQANLTLFTTEDEFEVNASELSSKAYNNPYIGRQLPGRIYGIVNGDRAILR